MRVRGTSQEERKASLFVSPIDIVRVSQTQLYPFADDPSPDTTLAEYASPFLRP